MCQCVLESDLSAATGEDGQARVPQVTMDR